MTKPNLVAVSNAPEHDARIDTPTSIRAGAGSIAIDANRIGQMLGRHWTTPAAEAEAEQLCLQVAINALALHRLIGAARKARG